LKIVHMNPWSSEVLTKETLPHRHPSLKLRSGKLPKIRGELENRKA